MESFEFIFAMQMLDPILNLILHVSTILQSSDINLLTAIDIVRSLKKSLESMRNDENGFKNIYNNIEQLCKKIVSLFLLLKKEKYHLK